MSIPASINSGTVTGNGLAAKIHYWRTHMSELPGGAVSETVDVPDGSGGTTQITVSSPKLEKDAHAIAYGIVEYFEEKFKDDERMHPDIPEGGP